MLRELTLILVFGTISGGILSLLALGFTLIYGVSRILNLAHGSLYMIGAYMLYVFTSIFVPIFTSFLGSSFPNLDLVAAIFAALAAIGFTGGVGAILYIATIHPIIGDEIATMVSTVTSALIIQQIILIIFGSTFYPASIPIQGSSLILGVTVGNKALVALSASLILFGFVALFVNKSKIGKAMKALSQDREAAMLMGVNTTKLFLLAMAISAMLAATAGILEVTALTGTAAAWMWLHPLASSFAIVILGGLGSIKGSLIGSFIIAYSETVVKILVGGAITPVVPLVVMMVILLIRSKGLFGKRVEMED
jgi:branched-chain amino acid transport system permease protein